ncbi:acyl-CoA dehydrogenase [Pseudomonas aeruginosa]|uniref:acyl-CoA dehydrogenase n=1 Tax=Pseudomonas aeruginosa TaxID=287 RepID=UPI000EB364AE|nr:acyl-CoA dehydrogenase [Pseudomonas aeruginosa]RTV63341.1 acyl-CoA dehydrogenase [Pseudomonas aeruginosa]
MTPTTNSDLTAWIGSTETRTDTLAAAPLALLDATLDRKTDQLLLPWHWLYFLPNAPTADLGADGHPLRQGFLPPITAPRRMWAGSRIEVSNLDVGIGEGLRRTTHIRSVETKQGASGELVFLGLRHEISGSSGVLVREDQDLVYRDAPAPGAALPEGKPARTDEKWCRKVQPTSTLLMRFSALTFNAHRIHYDRDYATHVEGYPGLVVHGPLVATLLLDLAYEHLPGIRVVEFSFRAVRPLFDGAPFYLCACPAEQPNRLDLWARDADGFVTTQAKLAYA